MKTIKVFLASSEELAQERLQFDSLFNHLNRIFRPRGIYLELSKWEYLDSSMGPKHKQAEYNDELRTCDICLVLYWTRFGEYTAEELEIAYNELKEGRNPQRLYVFFKEPADVTPELQEFKDSFATKYGHFYCKFENVDSMRLHFLLQLETFQNTAMKEVVKVEDSKIKVDGNEMANLDNLSFAANNKEYCILKENVTELQYEVKKLEKKLEVTSDSTIEEELGSKRTDLYNAKEELSKYENILYSTTRTISQQQRGKVSERMAKSMAAFEAGKASDANAILSGVMGDVSILKDAASQTQFLTEEQKEKAAMTISELLLSASTTLADDSKKIDKRIAAAGDLYSEAYNLAKLFDYDCEELLYLLEKYHEFLLKFYKLNELYDVAQELLALGLSVYGEEHVKVAEYYNNIAWCLIDMKDYESALEYCNKSLMLREKLLDKNNPSIAENYKALGAIYCDLARYDDASRCLDRAINIFRSNYGENHVEIAKCYSNYGQLNAARTAYGQAWEYQEKAVSIVKLVCGEKSEELARLYHLSADLCYRQNRVYDELDACKMGKSEYKKAMEYCSCALSIYLQSVGTYHQNVARLYWLMGLLDATQNGVKAKTYYKQARRIFEKINGRNCVEVAQICLDLSSLADVAYDTQARLYREEALEIMIAATGNDSLYTADCYVLLAETCSHYSDGKDDAAEYYEKALNIYISHYGENSQEVLNIYVALYNECIRFDTNLNKHKDILDKMLQISMSINGEADEQALQCQQLLGCLYYEDGVDGKTLEYWDKKLQTEILYCGENSRVVAETYIAYGEFYNHHNEYERAVEYLTKAYEIYVGIYGNKDLNAQNISRQIKFIKNERMHKKSIFSRIFGK